MTDAHHTEDGVRYLCHQDDHYCPDPPEELYPCGIAVFCDECGLTVRHDYVVSDRMPKIERLQVARNHLAKNEGWLCIPGDDLCPKCRHLAEEEPDGE
jgi:hypothetical protein